MRTVRTESPVSAITAIHIGAYPNAASIRTIALSASAKAILKRTVFIALLLILIAVGNFAKVPLVRTASADSIAASLPSPIAKPQSAAASTGASFIPSPTKMTFPSF